MAKSEATEGTETPEETIKNQSVLIHRQTKDLAELSKQVAARDAKLQANQQEIEKLHEDLEQTRTKLRAAKSVPIGDVVYLEGKSWPIIAIVRADQNFEQVKRGHIHEGLAMAVIKKQI